MLKNILIRQSKALVILLLMLIFYSNSLSAAEIWRGPAHVAISTTGTFALSELPTLITDDYKIHNLYLLSATLMLTAGFGKEAVDEMTPGKKFSWEDIGLDILGITLGVTSHYFLTERRKKRRINTSLNINQKSFSLFTSIKL